MSTQQDLSALRAAVIEAANRVDIHNRETRETNLAAYRAAAAALHSAEAATGWSHRADLDSWQDDFSADFEET